MMLSFFHAIILSIVEGVTEFLPISSTGHLILVSRLLQIPETDFVKTFEIAIQLGAIASVAVLYFKKLWFKWDLIKKLIVAFIPTGFVGLVLYHFIKGFLLGNAYITLITLFLGGVFLIFFEKVLVPSQTKSIEKLSLGDSFWIGVAQSVSVVPGVSRAAATIVGGMFRGLDRESATEFSFMLAVPTMIAATGYDALKSLKVFTSSNLPVLAVGFIVSFVVAWISVKFLLDYVKKHDFTYFGVYRIIISILYWVFVLR